jgi:oligopeptide transport system permease protein
MAGASRILLYRHEYPPQNSLDWGLPLIALDSDSTGYCDTLRLEAIDYYYTLVADSDGALQAMHRLDRIHPLQAIRYHEAVENGLLRGSDPVGTVLILPSHPLGTDYLGRDLLARIIQGARTSLFIGIVAPLLFIIIGGLYGGVAGFVGGTVDREMMRAADFTMGLPFLLFMILFKVMFGIGPGESGVMPMLLALILLSWPATARVVRAQVLQGREMAYVDAARIMGAGPLYLIFRHLLPNLLSVVLVSLTFSIPNAIFTEAFLSFIGMGVVPPVASWGSLCNDGLRSLLSHPHELFVPAFFVSVTVLAFNLLGDGLRDALDIRLRSVP